MSFIMIGKIISLETLDKFEKLIMIKWSICFVLSILDAGGRL